MQIEQLRYLVEVAKTRSVSQAASNLYVTQPAISKSLKKLEMELGVQLFTKGRSGIVLTPIGTNVVNIVKTYLSEMDTLELAIRQCVAQRTDEVQGEIAVSLVPCIAEIIFPKVLAKTLKLYPSLSITLFEKNMGQVVEDIALGYAELGVICANQNLMEAYPQLAYEILANTQIYCIMSKEHPLASKKMLQLREIQPYKLVSQSFYKNDDDILDMLYPTRRPIIAVKSNRMDMIIESLVSQKLLTIISDLYLDYYLENDERLMALPILDELQIKVLAIYQDGNRNDEQLLNVLNAFRPFLS